LVRLNYTRGAFPASELLPHRFFSDFIDAGAHLELLSSPAFAGLFVEQITGIQNLFVIGRRGIYRTSYDAGQLTAAALYAIPLLGFRKAELEQEE
jgi:hypothetical protein